LNKVLETSKFSVGLGLKNDLVLFLIGTAYSFLKQAQQILSEIKYKSRLSL